MTKPTDVGFAFDAQTLKGAHVFVRNCMNKAKRIICLALAVAAVFSMCAVFASCQKKKSGKVLATYDGGDVYESDVLDWQSFFLVENVSDIMKADDSEAKIAEVNDNTTKFYVQLKAFRKLLEDEGIATITEETIKKYAEQIVIPALNSKYEKNGGYDFWRNSYKVSENFVYDYAEEQLVTAYLEKYVMDHFGVTDELVYEYWEAHASEYLVVPSYVFDVIMVAIEDSARADVEAWEAAKAEAQKYIDRIKSGEDFADVKADALVNSKNISVAAAFSVKDSVPYTSCEGFEDEEENLKHIAEYFDEVSKKTKVKLVEYADPNGNSKEYSLWFSYCNMINEFYTKHALLNLDVGETIDEPIRHISGYEIIKLVEMSDKTEFQRPENNPEVYQDVYESLYAEMWNGGKGTSVEKFEKFLQEKYNVSIVYSYLGNHS